MKRRSCGKKPQCEYVGSNSIYEYSYTALLDPCRQRSQTQQSTILEKKAFFCFTLQIATIRAWKSLCHSFGVREQAILINRRHQPKQTSNTTGLRKHAQLAVVAHSMVPSNLVNFLSGYLCSGPFVRFNVCCGNQHL